MKNLKPILFLAFVITLCSCQHRVDLKADKLLTETFSKDEIQSFESMVDYVDKMVLAKTKDTDIDKAYHQFFTKVSQLLKDSSKLLVSFNEAEKYAYLEKMDTSTFNDIWYFNTGAKMVRYQDSIYRAPENYKSLNLRRVGNYMNYLEKLGESDEFFKSLHESIDTAGDLPASTAIWFPNNHSKFDFNIPKNRLWAAIYILRIEDPVDIKMKRYLNE